MGSKHSHKINSQGTKSFSKHAVRDILWLDEEFSSTLLNNSPYPILLINSDLSVRYVNPSLEILTGFSANELIGLKPPYPWWTASAKKLIEEAFQKGLKEGINRFETQFQKKCGETFWVEITAKPVFDKNGLKYYIANWVNITELKTMIEALRHREKELMERTGELEKVNAALYVLLERRQRDRIELEEMVLLNIKSNIIPKIRSISNLCRTEKEKNKLVVLEKSLNKITSPFLRNISSKYLSLTPREIEVADLIKDGKTSKEISEMLFLSVPTVNFHRKNIRKKMNIRKGKNLNSFLRTLQFR